MCGIFAIGPYHWAVLSNIHRQGVEEPERPTMTTTGRHGIRGQATENHSVTSGLCNTTSEGVDGAGFAAPRVYRHFADVKEAGGIRDDSVALAEGDQDDFVA